MISKRKFLCILALSCCFAWDALQAAAVQIKDDRGRLIEIDKPPQRIASGSLASDEIIFALLKEAQQLSRIVALSSLVDNPDYSNIVSAAVGVRGRFGGELETLLKLNPDLVLLANFNKPETIKRLEQAKIKTFVLPSFTTMNDISHSIHTLGALLQMPDAAKKMQQEFERNLNDLQQQGSLFPKRYRLAHIAPDGSTSGKNTLFDQIASAAGGINVIAERGVSGWPNLNAEVLAQLDIDACVMSGNPDDPKDRATALRTLQALPGWKSTSAARDGKLILIPNAQLWAVSPHVLDAIAGIQTQIRHLFKLGTADQKTKQP